MPENGFVNDPRWREISSSLRNGQLFVKLPVSTAALLLAALRSHAAHFPSSPAVASIEEMATFLRQQIRENENASSIVFALSEEVARNDVGALFILDSENPENSFKPYLQALEKGLRGDPEVDWIARVGGPTQARQPLGLHGPTRVSDIDLSELFG